MLGLSGVLLCLYLVEVVVLLHAVFLGLISRCYDSWPFKCISFCSNALANVVASRSPFVESAALYHSLFTLSPHISFDNVFLFSLVGRRVSFARIS